MRHFCVEPSTVVVDVALWFRIEGCDNIEGYDIIEGCDNIEGCDIIEGCDNIFPK